MPSVTINDRQIEIAEGERLNGIQAARRAGIEVPHYCWHPGLTVVASCRMCLVETGTRDPKSGEVRMMPKLVPACQTPATDGTVFITESQKIEQARAFVEEGLLIDHPIDCPICDKAGECYLQDYHFKYGQTKRRADIKPFTSRRRPMGDTVTLFVDRCVMCSRCVRFCREVSGTSELLVINRGAHEEIDVLPGYPLDNKLSGNVVDLCPVGALGDRDFLYQQRVWFMRSQPGVCTGCSTGCSIHQDANQDRLYRLRPRENSHVNQWWMCDEGRYGWHYLHDERRLVGPQKKEGDKHVNIEWTEIVRQLPKRLRKAGHVAAVLSPHLTVEEAYLLARYVRRLDAEALLVLGPVVTIGEDEVFPSGFTIHADKCPNRRGVEEIIRHFAGHVTTFDEFLDRTASVSDRPDNASNSPIHALWITGGYPQAWIDDENAGKIAGQPELSDLIVQDILPSPLWDRASWRLPSAGFAEKEGSYVNHAGRLQSTQWAIRPPQGARPEGDILWRLSELAGLFNARRVLDEIAETIPYFAAAAQAVPDVGVQLGEG